MIHDYATVSVATQDSATRAGMAHVLGMLDSDTVERAASQSPSDWQALAVAEQARRDRLEDGTGPVANHVRCCGAHLLCLGLSSRCVPIPIA